MHDLYWLKNGLKCDYTEETNQIRKPACILAKNPKPNAKKRKNCKPQQTPKPKNQRFFNQPKNGQNWNAENPNATSSNGRKQRWISKLKWEWILRVQYRRQYRRQDKKTRSSIKRVRLQWRSYLVLDKAMGEIWQQQTWNNPYTCTAKWHSIEMY